MKNKPGRPALGIKRLHVSILPADHEKAKVIGNGKFSMGVRKAIQAFKLPKDSSGTDSVVPSLQEEES